MEALNRLNPEVGDLIKTAEPFSGSYEGHVAIPEDKAAYLLYSASLPDYLRYSSLIPPQVYGFILSSGYYFSNRYVHVCFPEYGNFYMLKTSIRLLTDRDLFVVTQK